MLSNTTLGMLMAMIDTSIVLIALPDIFKGIHINPLEPGNTFYLLWMILGFMIVTAVLVVSLGRLGDMLGRVRMYNMGFVIYTFFSLMLSITWMTGTAAGIWLVVMRLFQGVGAAFLIANSTAILTDAFPEHERGMAVGINQIAAIAGSFIGLILGGLLGPIEWRLVFIISVPIGVFGSIWSYMKLKEVPTRRDTRVDWSGNLTFALGLVALMVGITYGIQPYGGHVMGWSSPFVLLCLAVGIITLFFFARIETRSPDPMFRLSLFRIRAFTSGSVATLFSAIGRGGLMFTMVIWLQGIWLPLHGYNFSDTPLWAGIALLPLTAGFLVSGPLCGYLSDRYGARIFTVSGMTGATVSFLLLQFLPANFSYPIYGALLFLNGISFGMFAAPNRAAIMNSLPQRAPRSRLGHGLHVSELRAGPLHRHLLQPDDHRTLAHPAPRALRGSHGARDIQLRGPSRLDLAAGVHALCLVPRLQPDAAPTRRPRPQHPLAERARHGARTKVLSEDDREGVRLGAAPGPRFCGHPLWGGRGHVVVPRLAREAHR